MSNIKLSIEPGFYLEAQNATWNIGPEVDYFVFNRGGPPPAISEYIAYDNLSPPNPFIAVTQDGLGNVVYDGGFPKFYNSFAPAAGTSFSALAGAMKFLVNALRWIANPEKVAVGNNKILVLGDNETTYRINGTDNLDFKTTFDRVFAIAGFVPTYKVKSQYGALLDPRLSELNQYCAVLVMSSASTIVPQITDQAVTDITTFRSQGNGIMLVTDHGQVVNNHAAAIQLTANSFFATANKIAVQFGAYFSGDFDRVPVNVGFLRSTYGDHPLYANMADSEMIHAGASESKVVVATYQKYTAANAPVVSIDKAGTNRIQAVAVLKNGNIETYRGYFVIAEGDLITLTDDAGGVLSLIETGNSNLLPELKLATSLAGAGTVLGEIRRNNTKIATFAYTDELGTNVSWVAGAGSQNIVNDGDVISAVITAPFNYSYNATVARFQPSVESAVSLADIAKKVLVTNRPLEVVASKMIAMLRDTGGHFAGHVKKATAENILAAKGYFKRTLDGSLLPVVKLPVFLTPQAATSGLAGYVPPTLADVFNTWGRTQGRDYYPAGSAFPTEAAAWEWNPVTKSVVQPLNTSSVVSFISPDKKDAYVLDVVLSSTNGDDDGIGVLLAFPSTNPLQASQQNSLIAMVVRSPMFATGASLWVFYINSSGARVTLLTNNHVPTQASDNGGDGWAGKTRRLRVTRKGDFFKIDSSDWGASELLEEASVLLDLNDYPVLAEFKGEQHYGLTSFSQAASTYSNLSIVDGSVKDTALVVSTKEVFQYILGNWEAVPGVNLQEVYGVGRIIENSINGQRYRVGSSGQLIAI